MSDWKAKLACFIPRLEQPSTWRGLTLVITACGVALKPDQAEAIGVAGAAFAGLLGVFLPDSTPQQDADVANHTKQ